MSPQPSTRRARQGQNWFWILLFILAEAWAQPTTDPPIVSFAVTSGGADEVSSSLSARFDLLYFRCDESTCLFGQSVMQHCLESHTRLTRHLHLDLAVVHVFLCAHLCQISATGHLAPNRRSCNLHRPEV